MLLSFTDITMKHEMTEKCTINLQNMIKISYQLDILISTAPYLML